LFNLTKRGKMEKLISWIEIPTVDFERAVVFYNSVLKLKMQPEDYGKEKMACFPNGEGAITYAQNFKPSENGVMVSFAVSDSINETLLRIEQNGGKALQTKTRIEAEGKGYFAIFLDSEGNKVGLYEKN